MPEKHLGSDRKFAGPSFDWQRFGSLAGIDSHRGRGVMFPAKSATGWSWPKKSAYLSSAIAAVAEFQHPDQPAWPDPALPTVQPRPIFGESGQHNPAGPALLDGPIRRRGRIFEVRGLVFAWMPSPTGFFDWGAIGAVSGHTTCLDQA
jgi:hypothetical protein